MQKEREKSFLDYGRNLHYESQQLWVIVNNRFTSVSNHQRKKKKALF